MNQTIREGVNALAAQPHPRMKETAEVLDGDDVDRAHRPEAGELDAAPVGHDDVTALDAQSLAGHATWSR
ncbi:hypothetical protein ACFYW9_25295 [Streptomyces sp. NPDC002698]|uniref:hypothetical protein n=1 Tax=Streptomyces sp. NPDC002698 TaxID=3364660 RepID=UPI0036A02668